MAELVKQTKACTVNPLKMSQPIGGALAFMGMRGAMPLLHGSQGCTSFGLVLFVRHFREAIPLTGLVLTKMEGDARGGAAISIRSVTGVPIKFLGTGEGLDALEVYDPGRLSSRILGMGDMIGLIEKAEAAFDAKSAQGQAEKMMTGKFDLEDFMQQLRQIKKMGPLTQLLEMMPGQMGQMAKQIDPKDAEKNMKQTEAIISSMTTLERRDPEILNASRRRRIAAGSGTDVQDVNRLIKQFREAQKLMKTLQKSGGRGLPKLFG